jgi:hypothetical protein
VLKKLFDFRAPRGHYRADAFVLWCFDERFDAVQERHPLIRFLFAVLFWIGLKQFNPETSMLHAYIQHKGFKHPDVVKWAGGAKALTSSKEVDHDALKNQIATSIWLHETPFVAIMLHVDCGAYGGSKSFHGLSKELQSHIAGLCAAGDFLQKAFPGVVIELLIADFEGLYVVERPITQEAEKSRPHLFF